MTTKKLTLRLKDTVIRKAKKTARSKGGSLSQMAEDYFKSVANQEAREGRESPVLHEIAGVLTGKKDTMELRSRYRKRLAEKYR